MRPWIIHEAEIALYPAWKDGTPFLGPGLVRGRPEPVMHCRSSLSITENSRKVGPLGQSWTGAEMTAESSWDISVSFPDAAFNDEVSRVLSRVAPGGFHVLVVRFVDQKTGDWSCFRWFYVTVDGDESGESQQVVARSLKLHSTWMQESVGQGVVPSMLPLVHGEVDWICGSRRVTCMTYDPLSEVWSSTVSNQTGDGSRYVNIGPVAGSSSEVAISAYFPRVAGGPQVPPALPVAVVHWQNLVLARIGSYDSVQHHGMILQSLSLQTLGIVEPLVKLPQDRMLDEPVVVFRYLRRVYASFGHGVFAVPRMVENQAPPLCHDLPFRLAIPGLANPATGMSGLVLLPDGGWLDGTLNSIF